MKIGMLIALLVFIIFCTLLFDSFSKKYPDHQNDFLYDPFLMRFSPENKYIQSHPTLKQIMTLSLSSGMDMLGLVLIILYCFKGKSSHFIPALIIFQAVRAIALNIVIFPVPETFILESPGVPSVSTAFERTNDLYFSGHIGTVTIFLFDCVFYHRKLLSACLLIFLFYTGCFLLLQGVHYMNDVIIGFVAAMTICRCVYMHRFYFSLGVLTSIGKVCFALDCCKNIKKKKSQEEKTVSETVAHEFSAADMIDAKN